MAFPKFPKDPDALLDFTFDWDDYLTEMTDTIASVEFIAEAGITINEAQTGDGFIGTKTTVWLEEGTAGEPYNVIHRITTTDGRIDDRTMTIDVKEK